MKKFIVLIPVIVLLSIAFFIPVSQQQTVVIKASFFNVYKELASAGNWERWRPDIRKPHQTDSTKILEKQNANEFTLNFSTTSLQVIVNGYSFNVREYATDDELNYNYTVIPEKLPNYTSVVVTEKVSLIRYLINLVSGKSLVETHIADLKNFMEDADLYYGYKITRRKVTDTNVVVLRKMVLSKNKFDEAAKTLIALKRFIDSKGLEQTQPLIAQFFTKSGDSSEVNVGIPINGKVVAHDPIAFMRMPQTGSLYTVKFRGKFKDRMKAYAALQRYFNDRQLAMPLPPFETYVDDKLPQNESDIINIQINFTTF
ncbi:MAG: hypothetical protein JWR02_1832 [Mucilaginibacter sp.]|nr:hypothetical protein [Mucilaginibacter sp.]